MSGLNIKKLTCSSCNTPLMNYWITHPDDKVVRKIKATCPFCGDESFTKTISGKFFYGPIGKDESSKPTVVNDISFVQDSPELWIFEIRKHL